jgi:hypothetical protein
VNALSLALSIFTWLSPAPSPAAPSLVAQLGHRDFHAREAAARSLEALDRSALPALRAGVASTDPEVSARCRRLIDRIEAAPTPPQGRYPWLDSLGAAGRERWWPYLLNTGWPSYDEDAHDWPSFRYATALWAATMARAGVPRAWLVEVLAGMAKGDAECLMRIPRAKVLPEGN